MIGKLSVLVAGFAILAGVAIGQQEFKQVSPEPLRYLDSIWRAPIDPGTASGHFTVFFSHLYSAHAEPGAVSLQRWNLSDEGPAEPQQLALPEAAANAEVIALQASPEFGQLFLLVRANDSNHLFVADVDADGNPVNWREVPLPEIEGVPARLVRNESALLLLSTVNSSGPEVWAAMPASDGTFTWHRLPAPESPVEGFAAVSVPGFLMMIGGTGADRASVPPLVNALPLDLPDHGAWQGLALPNFLNMKQLVAAHAGHAFVVSPATTVNSDDTPTSRSIYASNQLNSSRFNQWRTLHLDFVDKAIRAMVIDEARRRLIVVAAAANGAELRAYPLPEGYFAAPVSPRDVIKARVKPSLNKLPRRPVSEVLKEAARNETYALVVITANQDEKTDAAMNAGATKFRYMTAGYPTTYVDGEDASELVERYSLKQTPAFLLLDPNGNIVSQHLGTVPNAEETFRLTSPGRRGAPMSDPPDEE